MVIPWTMALLQSMANLMERRKRHINRRSKNNSQFKGAREMKRKRNENCVAFTHCFWAFVNLILLAYLWTYGMVSFWLIVQFELRMRTKWSHWTWKIKRLPNKTKLVWQNTPVPPEKKSLFFLIQNSKDHLNCQQACWKEEIWIKIAMKRWNQIFNLRKD